MQRHADAARVLAARATTSGATCGCSARSGRGEVVGGVEDALRPTDGSRRACGIGARLPSSAGEVLGEAVDVGHARAAPAVDRLQRVADRGDRVAAAEQPHEQQALGDRGVLVLVEQHDAELVAQRGADVGALLGEPGAEAHLVGEVDEVARGAGGAELVDEVRELDAGDAPRPASSSSLPTAWPRRRPRRSRRGRRRAGPRGRGSARRARSRARARSRRSRRRRTPGSRGRGGARDDAVGELHRRGLGEQPRAGLDADAQAVLGDEPAGERVVGRDGRLADLLERAAGDAVGEPLHRRAHARRTARRPPCW